MNTYCGKTVTLLLFNTILRFDTWYTYLLLYICCIFITCVCCSSSDDIAIIIVMFRLDCSGYGWGGYSGMSHIEGVNSGYPIVFTRHYYFRWPLLTAPHIFLNSWGFSSPWHATVSKKGTSSVMKPQCTILCISINIHARGVAIKANYVSNNCGRLLQ